MSSPAKPKMCEKCDRVPAVAPWKYCRACLAQKRREWEALLGAGGRIDIKKLEAF